MDRSHGAISGYDGPCGAIDLGRRSLSPGPGRLSRCRRELVRGFCLCGVFRKEPARIGTVAPGRPARPRTQCRAGQQHYQQRPRACRQIPGARPVRNLRHDRQRPGVGHQCRRRTISRFILGGSWKSQSYLSTTPEALSPFDRSETNGFRCVRNIEALPVEALRPGQAHGSRFCEIQARVRRGV